VVDITDGQSAFHLSFHAFRIILQPIKRTLASEREKKEKQDE
jgi:hypothetical protein